MTPPATETQQEAYQKSIDLLYELVTKVGFLASKENVENYERIWSRDGIIAGIASLLIEDAKLIIVFKKTLDTLREHQDETGRIPSNVTPQQGHVSYGTTVGRIDATIWYIIGVIAVAKFTNNASFFEERKQSVDDALFYLRCLELNGRGLLYVPQGGDWADEYINHGYVLFDEVLYYFALSAYAAITNEQKTIVKKNHLRDLILINYFPSKENIQNPLVYNRALYEYSITQHTSPLPASYFTNHSIRFNTDTFATSLLLLSNIIEPEQRDAIRTYMNTNVVHDAFPILPAFHPVITPKDPEWDHLNLNFLYEFRNKPNQYHNGGLWPLVHGFFLSSLTQEDGLTQLDAFANVLARDGYIFPEYYHGITFEAMGTTSLGFSAASYLIAYESIVNNKNIYSLITGV